MTMPSNKWEEAVSRAYANGFCELCGFTFEEHRGLDHQPQSLNANLLKAIGDK